MLPKVDKTHADDEPNPEDFDIESEDKLQVEEQREQYEPAPMANAMVNAPQIFALCQWQVNLNRPLDYTKQANIKLYKSVTEPFNRDKPYDVDNAGLMQFMMEVHNCMNEHGWMNPNHGLCIITVMENNVTERFDLTTQYGCVTINQVVASNACKLQVCTRKAQNSMLLQKLLMGCLSSIGKNKVMTPKYR